MWPLGQAVKTPPSQGGIMGSIPVGVTKSFLKMEYQVLKRLLDTLFLYLMYNYYKKKNEQMY